MRDLRPDQIQALYTRMVEDGVGVYTVIKVHELLHSALQYAVRSGVLTRNPAAVASPPRRPYKEMNVLSESQASQLLIAVRGHRW